MTLRLLEPFLLLLSAVAASIAASNALATEEITEEGIFVLIASGIYRGCFKIDCNLKLNTQQHHITSLHV